MPDVGTSSGGGTTVAAPTGGSPTVQSPGTDDGGLAGQIDALLSNMGEAATTLATDHAAGALDAGSAPSTSIGQTPAADVGETGVAPQSQGLDEADGSPSARGPLSPGDVESLSAQIEALVDEVAATQQAGQQAGQQVGAAPAPSPLGSTGEVDVAREVGVDPTEPLAQDQARSSEDLSEGVDRAESSPADESTSEPESPPRGSIDLSELDAHLAAAANGVVQSPLPAPVESVAATLPVARAVGQSSPATSRVGGGAAASIDAALARPEPPTPAPAVATLSGTAVKERRPRPPIMPTLRRLARSATTSARPAGLWVLGMSATALERSPKVAQQTAGWIGLVTVFFACCMWSIVLFFRSTPAPEAYGVPSSVLEHGEPTPQPRPRPSAHAAEEPAADDGHGAKADAHGGGGGGGDAHGAADAHGGGGGGHGGH